MSWARDLTGRVLCLLYVGSIGVPLFILPGYRTTNWTLIYHSQAPATLDVQALRIHWSAAFAALVGAYFIVWCIRRRRLDPLPRLRLVAGLGVVFLLALLAGLATSPSRLSVVYFAQTILPMAGFLAGVSLAYRIPDLRRAVQLVVGAVTVSLAGILLLAYSYGALSADIVAANRLARAIPQFQDYFPFIVVASLSLAMGLIGSFHETRRRAVLAAAIGLHLAFFALVWSRMAVIMLALVVVTPVVLASRSTPRARRLTHAILMGLLLAGIGVIVTRVSVLAPRLEHAGTANGTVQSDSRRLQYAAEALGVIAEEPVFGRKFVADWYLRVTGSHTEALRIPRMFRAHNQYLDYGIRAGVPAMLLLAAIVGTVVIDLRRALRRSAELPALRPLVVGVAGALLALAVGNLTQLFLVQAQTGSLAWFLVGVAATLPHTTRHDAVPQC